MYSTLGSCRIFRQMDTQSLKLDPASGRHEAGDLLVASNHLRGFTVPRVAERALDSMGRGFRLWLRRFAARTSGDVSAGSQGGKVPKLVDRLASLASLLPQKGSSSRASAPWHRRSF